MRPVLSQRARSLQPSATIAMDARAKALASSGADIVNLTTGEPDFDTPEDARRGGHAAIDHGLTKYPPTAGIPELRGAIAEKLLSDNGLTYTPDQIVVSNGAKQSVFNALMVLVDPGDEVVIPSPYWVSYPELVRLAGGIPVILDTRPTGYRISPEAVASVITPRTKVIVVNNPSNPTGTVHGEPDLRALAALAVDRDLQVISDEIYEKLVYGTAEFVSIASLGDDILRRTVTVNGFSKAYAMTGWRMGYAAADPPLAAAMAGLQSQCTSGASSISQHAALAALRGDQAPLEEMRLQFDRRRRYVVERLEAMPAVEVEHVPEGAFYIFPRVSDLYGRGDGANRVVGSLSFAEHLLEAGRVAVVPGLPFGSDDHIRISYAQSLERLTEGMDRIEEVVRALAA